MLYMLFYMRPMIYINFLLRNPFAKETNSNLWSLMNEVMDAHMAVLQISFFLFICYH